MPSDSLRVRIWTFVGVMLVLIDAIIRVVIIPAAQEVPF